MTDQVPISKQQRQIIHLQDQKPNGTGGGASTAGIPGQIRTLNTVIKNTITGASLAANIVTLPKGSYEVSGYGSRSATNNRAILTVYNETLATELLRGAHAGISNSTNAAQPVVIGEFDISAATEDVTVRQINLVTSGSSTALGEISGIAAVLEIYTNVIIERIG
jgi:hypothetical protein